jgi:hypothetical protein
MKKFTCGHCGGRLAVNPRHLERLVHCPECGKPTHPLAAEILSAAKVGDPAPRALSADPVERKCENCARRIGRLEKLELWENHLVCKDCHAKLVPPPAKPARASRRSSKQPELPAPADAPTVPAVPAPDAPAAHATLVGGGLVGVLRTAVAAGRPAPAAKPAPIVPVTVTRVAAATYAAVPPHIRQRTYIVLAAVFVAGLALYGLLSLLRDVMGLLLMVATILVCSALGWAWPGSGSCT